MSQGLIFILLTREDAWEFEETGYYGRSKINILCRNQHSSYRNSSHKSPTRSSRDSRDSRDGRDEKRSNGRLDTFIIYTYLW